MESWPAFDRADISDFSFIIDTRLGGSKTYQFYLRKSTNSTMTNMIVWGDGETSIAIGGSNRHTYSRDGIYMITVIGPVIDINFGAAISGNTPESLLLINSPIFADPNPYRTERLLSLTSHFKGCINLVEIPGRLLANFYNNGYVVGKADRLFEGCISLREVPGNLFSGIVFDEPMTGFTSIDSMFEGCASLENIPPTLFSDPGFSNVQTAVGLFRGTGITSIPSGIFSQFTSCDYFGACFADCAQLEETGNDLFSGNSYPWHFGEMYRNCVNLVSIGRNLFNRQDGGFFPRTFMHCVSLEEIPADLFRFDWNPSGDNQFANCFYGDSGITSEVPPLWEYYPHQAAWQGNTCYYGCYNAANYADIPDDWK